MDDKGMLIVISGPSGSGKGTVIKELRKDKDYALSVSATTRLPREGEVEGKDYFFYTKEKFLQVKKNNGFLEHAEFVGNLYGTPMSYVLEKIQKGKAVILEIDVIGALQIKEFYNKSILIFLTAPTKELLKKRLINRNTENRQVIERRLKKAEEEIKEIDKYDYLIINDKVENAIEQISSIVTSERLRTKNCKDQIMKFKGDE